MQETLTVQELYYIQYKMYLLVVLILLYIQWTAQFTSLVLELYLVQSHLF